MRPAGEIRVALLKAMRELNKPATSRMLAAKACVGFDATRDTLKNLVNAGYAVKPGTTRVAGVKRPVPLYALRHPVQLPLAFIPTLAEALSQ